MNILTLITITIMLTLTTYRVSKTCIQSTAATQALISFDAKLSTVW